MTTFVSIFITLLVIWAAWKVGQIAGQAKERRRHEKTQAELEARKMRFITLVGGHAGGMATHVTEAELKIHNNRVIVTATKDGQDFEELYEVQGNLGLHLEEVER